MPGSGPFELHSESVGPLPVVNHFLARMGLGGHLDAHLPHDDARLRLAPATVIALVVRNLIVAHRPVYALGEWAAPFQPGLLGLGPHDVAALNDDRVGRTLDRLFDADRASLITEVVLGVVRNFGVELSQLHNDSTTVTFSGTYRGATGRPRGAKATSAITYGHNKDHRPDLKQLLCVLTISADGAVPIAFRTEDGNTADDVTHIPTWDELRALVGRADFLYVADCKLANRSAMDHIDRHGGRFVTVLARTRREDSQFRDWIAEHQVDWTEAHRRPGRRLGEPEELWHSAPAPSPSAEGYRIIWVRSSTKVDRDAEARRARIAKGIVALDDLNGRLASPKTRIRTLVAVEAAAVASLEGAGATRWMGFEVTETIEDSFRQEKRGRPGADTRYRKLTRTHHRVVWHTKEDIVSRDAASDGCFPLITNDGTSWAAAVLLGHVVDDLLAHQVVVDAPAVAGRSPLLSPLAPWWRRSFAIAWTAGPARRRALGLLRGIPEGQPGQLGHLGAQRCYLALQLDNSSCRTFEFDNASGHDLELADSGQQRRILRRQPIRFILVAAPRSPHARSSQHDQRSCVQNPPGCGQLSLRSPTAHGFTECLPLF